MSSIQYAILNEGLTKFFKDMFGPSVKAAYYSKYHSNSDYENFEISLKRSNDSISSDFITYDKGQSSFDFDVDCVLVEFVTDNLIQLGVSAGYPLEFKPRTRSDVVFV